MERVMANKLMYRKEAEEFIKVSGWKPFLDLIIRDKIVLFEDLPPLKVIDVTLFKRIKVMRGSEVLYED
jgi:hypothetical protein